MERLEPETFSEPGNAAMVEAVRHQAEHFDETPAVIAACYARPQVPRDPRLVADLARAVGLGFLRRLASPRMAVVVGASSSYPGVQNLLIAARAFGLAANITVWHFFAENEFKRVLGVPKHVTIYALVPVGWPAGRFGLVRRRPVADVVHWDRW
jgi:nitroreductase